MADGPLLGDTDVIAFDGCATLAELFVMRCRENGPKVAHREKKLGVWRSHTWDEYFDTARLIGQALIELGVQRGEVVSILAEDRREWLYYDMGVMGIGAIANGVYTTDSARQLAYLVNDSDTGVLFVEDDEQLDKFLEVRDEMPGLRKVVVFDRDGLREFQDDMVIFYDDLLEMGRKAEAAHPGRFEAELEKAQPEDTLTLIYTSGTTGAPKGAMISHRNAMYQLVAGGEVVEILPGDEQLCFLPLCHIVERLFTTYNQLASGMTVNFAESLETVFDNLREVSPHTFTAVPRVWEKIFSQIQILRSEATGIGRWSLDQAIAAGTEKAKLEEQGKPVPAALAARYRLWDIAVLRNLRRMLGMDRLRRGGCGAAPVSPNLLRWFAAIGVPVFEGYGQTESSGVVTLNIEGRNDYGTVGFPVPGSEIRIDDNGEILVRGPTVFKGYWNKPEKTAETVVDGWLHTGDVGRIGNNGALTITGRIKDIIITAGGKNITPAEIESRLKFSPFISDAIIIGDQRKYLTCLVMIDQENVEKFAQDRAVPFSDFASLCAAEPVVELIGGVVAEVNKEFARVEQIKDFRLIDILLTAEDDELTPTMKLKRSFVETKHKALIDSMYAA